GADGGTQRAYQYLCHLDNHLLGDVDGEPLIKRTRRFLEEPWRKVPCAGFERDLAIGVQSGLRTAHYWFYKLDFVLWYERARDHEHWQNFRFTAKNSVEHISPQRPRQT